MPTYDYRCEACGHAFEKFQSITAEPIKECPACGKKKAKRLIGTGAGIIFKGGGFYETDYRSGSYNADAKKDSGDASSGDSKSDKGGDSKEPKKADAPAKAEPAKAETKPAAKSETSKPSKPAAKK